MAKKFVSVVTAILFAFTCVFSNKQVFAEDIATSTEDVSPPNINNIYLSTTTVEAPGRIEIIIDATDDVSGFNLGYEGTGNLWFTNTETGDELFTNLGSILVLDDIYEYSDGKIHGLILVDQYTVSGEYVIDELRLSDKAGNRYVGTGNGYDVTTYGESDSYLPKELADIRFTVINNGNEDITPPVLNDISFSKTSVEAPGMLEVILDASDDVSGFQDAETGVIVIESASGGDCTLGRYGGGWISLSTSYVYDNLGNIRINDCFSNGIAFEDGKIHGLIDIDQYNPSDEYCIRQISIRDKAGNELRYDRYAANPKELLPEKYSKLSFKVTNSGVVDTTPPSLKGISFSSTSIETPGEIEMIVEIEDDVSGGYITDNIGFENTTYGNYLTAYPSSLSAAEDGKFHFTISCNQYVPSGEYHFMYMALSDWAGNKKSYSSDELEKYYFTVINNGIIPDVISSTSDSASLLSDINSVSDEGIVVADFSNNPEVSSDIFDAIAGTNKEVTFTSEGVSWMFNGADVKAENAKNINLDVSVNIITEEKSEEGKEIDSLVGDSSALVLHFADNGELPGKATIRIKADYALQEYLGTTGLNVYWFDETNKTLVPIASNVTISSDNNIVFDISHCSYYVVKGVEKTPLPTPKGDVNSIEEKLEKAVSIGANLVEWNEGDTLSISTMRYLEAHPELTLQFSYTYENKDYVVYISGENIVDENIPWYGPLYLAGKFPSELPETVAKENVYVVKRGDSLSKIANLYKTTVEAILKKNPEIKDRNKIYVGQQILY